MQGLLLRRQDQLGKRWDGVALEQSGATQIRFDEPALIYSNPGRGCLPENAYCCQEVPGLNGAIIGTVLLKNRRIDQIASVGIPLRRRAESMSAPSLLCRSIFLADRPRRHRPLDNVAVETNDEQKDGHAMMNPGLL